MTDKRKNNGRFAAGNSGGPGRPKKAIERNYLLKLAEACTLEDWQGIIEKTVSMAKDGDNKSREWLASYLLGAPAKESHLTLTRALASEELDIDEVEKAHASLQLEAMISKRSKALF